MPPPAIAAVSTAPSVLNSPALTITPAKVVPRNVRLNKIYIEWGRLESLLKKTWNHDAKAKMPEQGRQAHTGIRCLALRA